MLAILATSPNGERTRVWLQERLWGSRGEMQARASMRRELANLKKMLGSAADELLQIDAGRVRLRLEAIRLDVARAQTEGWAPAAPLTQEAEFLEGVDIRGEEAFETWIRNMRESIATASPSRKREPERRGRSPVPPTPIFESYPLSAALNICLPSFVSGGDLNADRGRLSAAAEELGDLLARTRWLRVIASDNPAHEAHFDYRIERVASVAEGEAILAIKVLRPVSRELIWTDRLTFAEHLVRPAIRLAARLIARLEREEQVRASRRESDANDFRALIWRARWRLNRLTRGDSAAAARDIEEAITLNPQSPEALIQKAVAFGWESWAKRAPRPEFSALSELARRAILLDPDDARGYWLAGIAETWLGNSNTSVAWLRRAIEIDPACEPAYAQLGGTYNMCDRPAEAIEALDIALSLSPNDTHLFFRYTEYALSCLLLGRYPEAQEWADNALLLRPGYWYAQTIKIYALVEMGKLGPAHEIYADLLRHHPKFDESYLTWVPFVDRGWVERIYARLRIAAEGRFDVPRLKIV